MYIKSALIIIVCTVIAWFVSPFLFNDAVNGQVIFTIGVLVGGLVQFVASFLLSRIKPKSVPGSVYVGNLAYSVSEDDVRNLFEKHGQVYSVRLMRDRATGKMRGFGFVEMNINDAERAITSMNGLEFAGRKLKVNSANEKKSYSKE